MASKFDPTQNSHDISQQLICTDSQETCTNQPDVNRQPDVRDSFDWSQVSPNILEEIDQEKVTQAKCDRLNILITGKTGSGKSTIVNGILGLDGDKDEAAAKEGDDISKRCTTEVKDFTAVRNGVTVTVWDSPGLQDGTTDQAEYLEHMKQKCNDRDLTLYCINASAARLFPGEDSKDLVAMKKLTETFGLGFWTNVVIILTFANNIISSNPKWARLSQEEKNEKFEEKVTDCQCLIRRYLCEFIGVPKEIVDRVTIVPAGHYTESKLFNREYWLSDLWVGCLNAMKTLGRQPIFLTEEEGKKYRQTKKRGAALGAFIGTVVGAVGYYLGKELKKQQGDTTE